MSEPREYYQVLQDGHAVGSFLKRKNAEAYLKEFNTKVSVSRVEIVVRDFLDVEEKPEAEDHFNWGAWDEKPDSTSKHGGV